MLHLERWTPQVGCVQRGVLTKEVWVRRVGGFVFASGAVSYSERLVIAVVGSSQWMKKLLIFSIYSGPRFW